MLDDVVAREDVMRRARELALFYAAKPPVAVQMIKRSVNRIAGALDRSIMDMDADQNLLNRDSRDFTEALRAYFEKDEPTYTGD